jgi:hypothetical protein
MLQASMRYCDAHWDEYAGLLAVPSPAKPESHRVRESAWYALGLLTRGQPGDAARSARIIETVLSQQFDAPGQPWNGTFSRAPEELA